MRSERNKHRKYKIGEIKKNREPYYSRRKVIIRFIMVKIATRKKEANAKYQRGKMSVGLIAVTTM